MMTLTLIAIVIVIIVVAALCGAQVFDYGYNTKDFRFFKARVPNEYKDWDEKINVSDSPNFGNSDKISIFSSTKYTKSTQKVNEEWVTTSAKKSTYTQTNHFIRLTLIYIPFPTEQDNIKARSEIDSYYNDSSVDISHFESENISIIVKIYSNPKIDFQHLSKKISDSIELN